MTGLKLVSAAAVLATLALLPSQVQARRHVHAAYGLPYTISYLHNYGPGPEPGTFAYYDGPSNNACFRGSASYRGQDGRKYPCF